MSAVSPESPAEAIVWARRLITHYRDPKNIHHTTGGPIMETLELLADALEGRA